MRSFIKEQNKILYSSNEVTNVLHESSPHLHLTWMLSPLQAGWDPGGFPQFVLHQAIQLGCDESSGIGTQIELDVSAIVRRILRNNRYRVRSMFYLSIKCKNYILPNCRLTKFFYYMCFLNFNFKGLRLYLPTYNYSGISLSLVSNIM